MDSRKIIEIIEKVGGKVNECGEFENMNSLLYVAFIVELEKEFEVEIPDEYLGNKIIDNVASALSALENSNNC